MKTYDIEQLHARIVDALSRLTDSGIVRWAQSGSGDPGLVLCAFEDELIQFEVIGEDGITWTAPTGAVGGITANFRGISLLFLPQLNEGRALLDLLKCAPVDDNSVRSLKHRMRNQLPDVLEKRLRDVHTGT